MEALSDTLDALKEELSAANSKVDAADAVQKRVQDAYDKVVAAVDALDALTAQSQISKGAYDALVEQYNQAMKAYEEALTNAQAADQKLSELAESVQRVIAAAEGSFSFRTPAAGNNGMGNANPTTAEGTETGDTEGIADDEVPLAHSLSQTTGSAYGESIADDEVPLAAAANQKTDLSATGIFGMIAAAFAAFLLLFKRKKDEDEDKDAAIG